MVGPRRRRAVAGGAPAHRGGRDRARRAAPAGFHRQRGGRGSSEHEAAIGSVVAALWAALTGAGVARRQVASARAPVRAIAILEWAGRVAPVSFVVGYLLILSALIHRIVVVRLAGLTLAARTAAGELRARRAGRGGLATGHAAGPDRMARSRRRLQAQGVGAGRRGVVGVVAGGPERVLAAPVLPQPAGALLSRRLAHARAPTRSPGSTATTTCRWPTLARPRRARPYPIFNAALNLVGGKNLAWQQRKAASFVFTPGYCGFEYRVDEQGENARRLPAVPTGAPAHHAQRRSDSLTVGLAMAISGAAASPNMGYHSSPTLAFLMTVFNVRLGLVAAQSRAEAGRAGPTSTRGLSLRELLYELLGMTTDDAQVGLPVGRRPLREPRHLRAGAPPLPLHHRVRRRAGRRRHVRGSRQRHREVPRRLRRGHRNRRQHHHAARAGRRQRVALRDRAHPLRPARSPTKLAGTLALHQELADRRRAGRRAALRGRAPRVSARADLAISSSTSRSSKATARWAATSRTRCSGRRRRGAAERERWPGAAVSSTRVEIFTRLTPGVGAGRRRRRPTRVQRYSAALDAHLVDGAQHAGAAVPRRADVPGDAEPDRPALRPARPRWAPPPTSAGACR